MINHETKTHKVYFETEKTARAFGSSLPRGICEIVECGKEAGKQGEPYYIEYRIVKGE